MTNRIKLHIYLKKEIIYIRGWQDQEKLVYIDNMLVAKIYRGQIQVVEVDLEPGQHCITVQETNVFKTKKSQYFMLNEDTTDIYLGCQYKKSIYSRGRSLMIVCLEQFNKKLYQIGKEKNIKLTIHRIYGFNQKKDYSVTIDDNEIKYSNGQDIEFYVEPGKHVLLFDTIFVMKYAEIDIPNECKEYSITIEENQGQMSNGFIRDIKVLSVGAPRTQDFGVKRIECVINRDKRMTGCAVTTHLEIDNDIKIELKNGESKTTFISPGKHKIVISGVQASCTTFEVPEQCNKVCINITKSSTITAINVF